MERNCSCPHCGKSLTLSPEQIEAFRETVTALGNAIGEMCRAFVAAFQPVLAEMKRIQDELGDDLDLDEDVAAAFSQPIPVDTAASAGLIPAGAMVSLERRPDGAFDVKQFQSTPAVRHNFAADGHVLPDCYCHARHHPDVCHAARYLLMIDGEYFQDSQGNFVDPPDDPPEHEHDIDGEAAMRWPSMFPQPITVAARTDQKADANPPIADDTKPDQPICTCPSADMLADGWRCTCGAKPQ